jgi:hypothetical protein
MKFGRTPSAVIVVVAVCLGVLVGVLVATHRHSSEEAQPGGGNNAGSTLSATSPAPSNQPSATSSVDERFVPGSAEYTAAHFIQAEYQRDYHDPNPWSWVDKIEPYVTQRYWATQDALRKAAASGNAAGSDAQIQAQAVKDQQITFIRVASSKVVTETGATTTSEVVRVVYHTKINQHGVEGDYQPAQSTNCWMKKVDGKWLVDSFGNSGG